MEKGHLATIARRLLRYKNISFLVVLLLFFSSFPHLKNKPLNVQIKKEYYNIKGTTLKEIIYHIKKKNIKKSFSHNLSGASVQASLIIKKIFLPKPVNGKCLLKKNNIRWIIKINYVLPLWVDIKKAPKSLQKRWGNYFSNILIHENGHRDHFIDASKDIKKYLDKVTLDFQSDCLSFMAVVKKKMISIFRSYEKKSLQYDIDTQHGLNQGVLL
tara:strand:+ start:394 stop:1035 length:642 start_codon:yes stop_codon:yes gene_type:complete